MQQQVEQMDLFAYLNEIEKLQEEQADHWVSDALSIQQEPIPFNPQLSFISLLKSTVTWLFNNLTSLFGLIQWVNVYTVTRAFGGSEEGGWYYRRYTCEVSRQVWRWDAEALRMELLRRFSNLAWGMLSSESVGQEVEVFIEKRKAAQENNNTRPCFNPDLMLKPAAATNESSPELRLVKASGTTNHDQISRRYSANYSHEAVNRFLALTGVVKKEPCERCGGSGFTQFKHIQGGICFICKGSGSQAHLSS
ncbi:hypothetical protein M2277_005636 [Paenibacillus sp. LBL]|uniref:hypothetical protein n=1 Tax=Paenibacillus sp. LBL TaxID=2940563 RepID=UPI002473414C|nr:hypothetical protein [Paenibacillus sp. LBL]MDH6674937.1 hypothetical protein [Paenibacillus sp. LBL]